MNNGETRVEHGNYGSKPIRTNTDGFRGNRHLLEEDMLHLKGGLQALADLLANIEGPGPDPKGEDLYCLMRCIMTKADLVEGDYKLLLGD